MKRTKKREDDDDDNDDDDAGPSSTQLAASPSCIMPSFLRLSYPRPVVLQLTRYIAAENKSLRNRAAEARWSARVLFVHAVA